MKTISTYNNSVRNVTAASVLIRRVTASAGTHALTLPSSKGRRKEFTVISTSGTATATAVAPDTIVGLATVAVNTSGTFRAIAGKWFRVS